MRALAVLILAVALTGCVRDGAADPDASTPDPDAERRDSSEPLPPGEFGVRIATWNVERLFDTECQSRCGGGGFEDVLTQGELRSRAEGIASALRSIDADIVVLQEVENDAALTPVLDELGEGWEHYVAETGPGTVDVAFVSRFPILDVRSHRARVLRRPDGSQTSFTRDFVELHFDVEGSVAIVFGAHFKSQADDDDGRRLAEGGVAGEIVAEVASENPDALVVLGGDLNDTPGSDTLRALERSGTMHRVAEDLANDGTYRYRGDLRAIDHLYLASTEAGAYTPRSAEVEGGANGLAGSDHSALVADFVLSR